MAMLEPKLSILDETDSGLDVDAMRIVANGVNKMHSAETSAIVITHYERLLDMIKPDVVHVLGRAASSRLLVRSWRRKLKNSATTGSRRK